ncbi:hypothetical protein [Kiloniella majae]|uniref:hypothetical protein n=1 Tax=Kiloniella majae TaxID=1938558 RepID=UPI000A27919F|nr:hypothetical protein [Kiloniella majae]
MYLAQKTKAAELAMALTWGYAALPEAIEWADEQILYTDAPDNTLFDLSLATGPNEAAGYLRALSEGTDEWLNLAYFLCRFHTAKTMNLKDASQLAKHLYMVTQYGDPPEPFRAFTHHWDAIDLARDGYYEDRIVSFLNDIRNVIVASGGPEFKFRPV